MDQDVNKMNKLIAVYARVSTAKQEEEGTIETQLSAVRDFADKSSFSIVKEYIDNGWSGDILARPQLDQLRQDAKNKIWEAVLIYDPDRLARRYSYQELVMDELKEAGTEVLFVTTPSPKTGEEKILHGVKGLFAEYERMKITERFRLGKLRKIKEGHVLTEAPYGYKYILKKDKTHGYYKVNQDEAKIVNMMFRWLVEEKLTIRGIVRKLQKLGIKPKKSKREVWSTSTLSHLFRNKTYIGEAYYGKSYATIPENPFNKEKYRKMRKTSRKMKPEEDWIKIPVPAIMDKNLFETAQEQLEENYNMSNRNKKNEYLLSGKIRCVCGNTRAGEGPQHGKHLYYRCTARVHNFPLPAKCAEKGINARIADKLVWSKISQLMSSPGLLIKYLNQWVNNKNKEINNSGVNTEYIKKEIIKLKNEEDRYTKAYGAGVFSVEKLKEYMTQIRDKISTLESQLDQDKLNMIEIGGNIPGVDKIEEFSKRAVKELQFLNFSEKQAIVRSVIDKVIGTQNELEVFGYIPITDTNYVKFQTIHRNCRIAECRKINIV
ncbi:MAG: recombinase family protein [Candidatus Paceibacterota bacterium]|jgi:site-specific DNA recombinase